MNPTDNITIGMDLRDHRHTVWAFSAAGDIVTEETAVPDWVGEAWSGRRESNPRDQFGKLEFYH